MFPEKCLFLEIESVLFELRIKWDTCRVNEIRLAVQNNIKRFHLREENNSGDNNAHEKTFSNYN
jgi:hypothetical protein